MKSSKIKISLIVSILFVLAGYQNCSPMNGTETEETDSGSRQNSQLTSNFSDIFEKIIMPKCVSCHSTQLPSDDIDLSSYDAIMNSNTVSAGNSGMSSLYNSMIAGTMPPVGAMDPSEIALVGKWIDDGAKDSNGTGSNNAPNVNSGIDKYIYEPNNTVTLNGTATDNDGTIVSTLWTQVSGPKNLTIASPNNLSTLVSGITVLGVYEFELKATDDQGSFTKDIIIVSLNPFNNLLPVVSTGLDKNIQPPVSSVSIISYASDSDGSISSYSWSQLSGPMTVTLTDSNKSTVYINNITTQGTYEFQVIVTDNKGATASDKVKVVLDPPPISRSYTNINDTIFKPKCLSCHSDGNPRGSYSMSNYTKIMTRVIVNDANSSLLFTRCFDNTMPPGNPLAKSDLDKIRDWINTGAPNN
jgi:hypothetical protein